MVDLLYIGVASMICVAFVSLLASVVTLTLIRLLKKWNGYLLLVTSLTVCQAIYDLAFLLLIFYGSRSGRAAYALVHSFGGLSSTLWSNVIMIITYRITKYLRSVDVHKEYKVYFLSVVTFSASFAVVNTAMMNDRTVDYFYLICKSLSMIVNIVLFGLIWHRIYRLMKTTSPKAQRQISVGATAPPMGSPVYALTTRLQYYCVVQTGTRIGASWYQTQYGFDEDSYDKDNATTLQNVAMLAQFILTPAAGLGYLLVFLAIQPDAYSLFKSLLKSICCRSIRAASSEVIELRKTDISVGNNGELLAGLGHRMGSSENLARSSMMSEAVYEWADMDEDILALEIDRLHSAECDDNYT